MSIFGLLGLVVALAYMWALGVLDPLLSLPNDAAQTFEQVSQVLDRVGRGQ